MHALRKHLLGTAQIRRDYLHTSGLMINELREFLILLEMLILWEQREVFVEGAEPSRLCLSALSWLCEKRRERGGKRIFGQHLLCFRLWARGSHTLHVVNPHTNPSKWDNDQPCCSWWKTWRSVRVSSLTPTTKLGSGQLGYGDLNSGFYESKVCHVLMVAVAETG